MFDKKYQVGFDTETHLIEDGLLVPRLVCMTLACQERPPALNPIQSFFLDDTRSHVVQDGGGWRAVLDRRAAAQAFGLLLLDPDVNLVAHNLPFDMAVLVRLMAEELGIDLFSSKVTVFDLFDPTTDCATVRDTLIREQLIAIGEGTYNFRHDAIDNKLTRSKYSLADLVRYRFAVDITPTKKGDDVWRLRYHELDGKPINEWPAEALDYALEDAVWALQVAVSQSAALQVDGLTLVDEEGTITDETPQTAAAWALHLAAAWGVRTDPEAVADFEIATEKGVAEAQAAGVKGGFVRDTGSKNMKALYERVTKAYHGAPPTTPGGKPRTDQDTLAGSGDPLLVKFSEGSVHRTNLSRYVPQLKRGLDHAMTSRPRPLKRSGRCAWSDPNQHNPPRKGEYRGCFVAREGYVYATVDWDGAELAALAQVQMDWFGYSALAEAINNGKDVHSVMAAEMLGVAYDDVFKHPDYEVTRQLAKVPNFGLPGGLGAETFVLYARGFGFDLNLAEAQRLITVWRQTWPESVRYLQQIGFKCDATGEFTAVQLRSGRIRGACSYTSGANTYFQGLVADIAKASLWQVTKECWSDPLSPLYGSRVWLLLHDEILIEAPEHKASDAAKRLATIMVNTAGRYHADVKASAEPALMRRWYKKAKPVYNNEGDLIPWEPHA